MLRQYEIFLSFFDKKLAKYFELYARAIKCKKGCSFCCKNGDYPLSYLEMCYLMKGFAKLEKNSHDIVRENIKAILESKTLQNADKSHTCPFLVNNECVVYNYRPLTCRIHGLAYLRTDGVVKLPQCARYGLNYGEYFDGKSVNFEPIREDLNLDKIFNSVPELNFGMIKSMKDWFEITSS